MNGTMQELDIELPEVSSKQKVEEYIHKQYFNYIQPKNMDPQIDNLSVWEFNTTKPPSHPQQALLPTPQVTQAPQQALPPTPQVTQAPQQALLPTPQVTQAPQQVLPPTPQLPRCMNKNFQSINSHPRLTPQIQITTSFGFSQPQTLCCWVSARESKTLTKVKHWIYEAICGFYVS